MNPLLQTLQARFGRQAALLAGVAAPLLVVAILAMMVLPLPPLLLDILFPFNIAIALVVMMVAAYMLKPPDFTCFPALLLHRN